MLTLGARALWSTLARRAPPSCTGRVFELGTISGGLGQQRAGGQNNGMQAQEMEVGEREGCLVIEKNLKSVMLRNIKRIKRFARVHISPFSPNLEMATFYGKPNDIDSAIGEFLGKFSVKT